jgi:hypothetical protein
VRGVWPQRPRPHMGGGAPRPLTCPALTGGG